jgi:hypothetical protein
LAPPLPASERRHFHNPFTGDPIFNADGTPYMIATTRPLGPWLERPRCPALAIFDPIDLSPVASMDVALLGKALGAQGQSEPEDALFAPESFGWSLHVIPESFVRALSRVASVPDALRAWHRLLQSQADKYFARLDADVSDWNRTVERLVELSRAAVGRGQRLFVYQGPDPEYVLNLPPRYRIEPGSLD